MTIAGIAAIAHLTSRTTMDQNGIYHIDNHDFSLFRSLEASCVKMRGYIRHD